MKQLFSILIICFLFGCAARVPSENRAQQSLRHFFKNYGKKYPETPFGKGVEKVEILKISEIRKHVAAIEAFITLKSGDLKKVNATLQKKTLLWSFTSWEDLEGS
ncbi:MAG: hypothetical protein A3I05_09680 [Deltaproteobacteria bacterium RIFCSPLOWO2_02_FULL_44_10]|nr:MAG: hypothetical protein A3C46_06460 [Deltaproteobacteria bacterium RIFCSPHIGHO2_02_FULL_44_16]OGQ46468.1 MAG: hypothetical protein A3I05_09680 [Deltaproteobacteria bacterium RIFCSPLOWO2_02_FULL_44_10]